MKRLLEILTLQYTTAYSKTMQGGEQVRYTLRHLTCSSLARTVMANISSTTLHLSDRLSMAQRSPISGQGRLDSGAIRASKVLSTCFKLNRFCMTKNRHSYPTRLPKAVSSLPSMTASLCSQRDSSIIITPLTEQCYMPCTTQPIMHWNSKTATSRTTLLSSTWCR